MKNMKKLFIMIFVIAFAFTLASCNNEQPPHEHDYSSVVTGSTCTEAGYTTYTCTCGDTYTEAGEAAKGHNYSSVVTGSTCTEAGFTTYTCTCGHVYTEAGEAAKGHNYSSVVTEPTCTEAGFTTYTCTCGHTYTETNEAAKGHKFIDGECFCGEVFVLTTGEWTLVTEINDGDNVLIAAPAYNKLLSAEKVDATSFYNKGVDYSVEDYSNVTDAEIFVVTKNADGTYTFTSKTGVVIALADSYASLNNTGVNKSWELIEKADGLFYLKNSVRGNYLEWYASKNNWSTYTTSSLSDLFELSFYAKGESTETEHVHNYISKVVEPTCTEAGYTSYTCRCEDTYSVAGEAATGHSYDEGKCTECGEKDPDYVAPVGPQTIDFNTIVTSNANGGDSSYTKTFTTESGWTITNSAIQVGGDKVMNPQFPVIGADNTFKAVCLNGKTTAAGKITSSTLSGGVSKISIDFTKMFTDTELSVTITVTEISTGNVYTHVVSKSGLPKDEKYVVYNDVWELETPVVGDYTIVIENNCPSGATGNKDRFTILKFEWQ